MAAPESEKVTVIPIEDEQEEESENSNQNGESDPDFDSDLDPSYSVLQDTHVRFSKLSIGKRSKSRIGIDLDLDIVADKEVVQKIIQAGQVEKLKVEQCKAYLRKNGLRLTGNKSSLIQRIKEHLEILDGEGEKKYPVSSFVLDCKGDACTGDVVMFEQNVYEMFNIASRSASGPPCGKRIVAGRIVKESYGEAKQQHTFTIEVLWSKGEKPLPPLHPLLIKGRNLYRLKTLRQRWEDEGERLKVLMEKHSRGFVARSNRETRILEKEKRKMFKANRMSINEDPKAYESQLNLIPAEKGAAQSQWQPALWMDSNKMKNEPWQPSVQPRQPGWSFDSRKPAAQPLRSVDSRKDTGQPQLCCYPGKLPLQSQEQKLVPNNGRTLVHANHGQPIFFNGHQSQINRQPLKRVNHHHPMSPLQRQNCMNKKVCQYYAQGRCHFGDNCKFLHEQRDECDQTWDNRRHHGHAYSEGGAH